MASPEKLPLTEEQTAEWRREIDQAITVAKEQHTWWQANMDAYAPKVGDNPKAYGENVHTNRDFSKLEQKKPQLFFQSPEVQIRPSPLLVGLEDVLQTHQDILNELLGPDNVDVKSLVGEVLFDVLCPAGFGVVKLGYDAVTVDVPVPDGLGAEGGTVPVPIWEEVYGRRVSPKRYLIPATYRERRYENAPSQGMRFTMPLRVAKRKWKLPEDFSPTVDASEMYLDDGSTRPHAEDLVSGTELVYKAALYDDAVVHPKQLRVLVILDGLDQQDAVVEHRQHPCQAIDPQTGRLTPDSLVGFPFEVLTLRVRSDTPWVPSDCTISRPQVNELDRFREQQIKQRDSNSPLRVYNAGQTPPSVIEKIEQGVPQGLVGLPDEMWNQPDHGIAEIARSSYARENTQFEEKQDNDISQTWAMDANQGGTKTDTARTATELQLIQGNTNVRLDAERTRVLEWYIRLVTKFSVLVTKYLRVEEAARIVGQPRAEQWAQVMKRIPSPLAFTAKPDSHIRLDAAVERKKVFDWVNFSAASPYINQKENWTQAARLLNMDPARLVVDPPAPPPEKPNITFSIKS